MPELFYTVPEHCADSYYSFNASWAIKEDFQKTYVAQEAAENYWDNHDGWESTWPLEICIYNKEEGELLYSCRVDVEYVPSFGATLTNKQESEI